MADVSQLPTSAQPEDPFRASMREAFLRHEELESLLTKAQAEIAQLQKELAELRAGRGIQIVIEGKRFVPAEPVHLVTDALSEQPPRALQSELADSFIL